MSTREVRSIDARGSGRERAGIVVIALLVVGAVGFYVALRSGRGGDAPSSNLLPYQTLVRSLPAADQQMYTDIRRGLPALEDERARTTRWPEPVLLEANSVPPFAGARAAGVEWQKFQRGVTVNYLGLPSDPSMPAWLLAVQEPEPNSPPDPAPLDDEHHRLPDGTTLHIYVWMHRYGGRVAAAFNAQPQNDGWTEVFGAPPNPVIPAR